MRTETYVSLCALYKRYGARIFGKICQKFVAIAFQMGGCTHVLERGVQGVDVDATWTDAEKVAIEVKTTVQSSVLYQSKDAEGLAKRAHDGYLPILAVLRLSPLSDWLFAHAEHLSVGRLPLDSVRNHRHHVFEQFMIPLFDSAVELHHVGVLDGQQAYLDQVLRKLNVQVSDSLSDS